MKNLSILQWELCSKNGLSVSYCLNGVNNYFNADKWRTTTLLSNCNLIQDRRIEKGKIEVKVLDLWVSLQMFVEKCLLLPCEIRLLTIEHLETQAISNASNALFFFKEPCLN